MGVHENKQRITGAIDAFNRGDVKGYLAAYSRQCALHGFPPPVPPTYDGLTGFIEQLMKALPDVRVKVEDVVAEGDHIAVRYTMSGTHKGDLLGAKPTNRRIEFEAITLLRFDQQGQIAERWQRSDEVSLLTQLGLLPAAAQAAGG